MHPKRDVAIFVGWVFAYSLLLSAVVTWLPRVGGYAPTDSLIVIAVVSVMLGARGVSWRRKLGYVVRDLGRLRCGRLCLRLLGAQAVGEERFRCRSARVCRGRRLLRLQSWVPRGSTAALRGPGPVGAVGEAIESLGETDGSAPSEKVMPHWWGRPIPSQALTCLARACILERGQPRHSGALAR